MVILRFRCRLCFMSATLPSYAFSCECAADREHGRRVLGADADFVTQLATDFLPVVCPPPPSIRPIPTSPRAKPTPLLLSARSSPAAATPPSPPSASPPHPTYSPQSTPSSSPSVPTDSVNEELSSLSTPSSVSWGARSSVGRTSSALGCLVAFWPLPEPRRTSRECCRIRRTTV
jgi:hypothetical protein